MTDLVATLIARPADGSNLAAAIEACIACVGGAESRELAAGEAVDILFPGRRPLPDIRDVLQRLVAEWPVDVVVQPLEGRRKKFLIADMDSTIIGQECIDELADFAGLKDKVSEITERAMRGEIEFEPALRERVALLKGLPASVIGDVLAERIRLNPGARALVATMRAHGARAHLVSGGFTSFVGPVAAMAGFDESQANRLNEAGGVLDGTVGEPILGREAKLAALREAVVRFGFEPGETLAVGDGANDLAMLDKAGLGVAYHAKPKVAAAAHARIDHGDLTALLFAQGYRRDDFAD